MAQSILVSVLAAGLVALPGAAAAQDTPPPASAVAPPAVAPPPAPAIAPPPAPAIAPPPVVESFPKASDFTDLGALSLTLGAFTGATVLLCGFTIGSGARRQACQGAIGGISLALVAASIPFFVLGVRKQRTTTSWIRERVTFTATTRGGALGWTLTF